MELVFKPVKSNRKNISVIGVIITGSIFFLAGIFMYLKDITLIISPVVSSLIFVLFGIIALVGGLIIQNISYKITDEGLILVKPMNRRLIQFSDILNIEKIQSSQAEKIIADAYWKAEKFRAEASRKPSFLQGIGSTLQYSKYVKDIASLTMYSSNPPSIVTHWATSTTFGSYSSSKNRTKRRGYEIYSPSKEINVSTSGEFVLLKVRRDEEPELILINPEKIDEFLILLNK